MCGIKTKPLAVTQSIIPLSTFKHKLKNFLLYVAMFFSLSGAVLAEGFTNHHFLKLPEVQQKFWIQGAMHMLVQVGAAKEKSIGQCVSDWYFGDNRAESNSVILASMEKYPDAFPSMVMLGLAEHYCGTFRN